MLREIRNLSLFIYHPILLSFVSPIVYSYISTSQIPSKLWLLANIIIPDMKAVAGFTDAQFTWNFVEFYELGGLTEIDRTRILRSGH